MDCFGIFGAHAETPPWPWHLAVEVVAEAASHLPPNSFEGQKKCARRKFTLRPCQIRIGRLVSTCFHSKLVIFNWLVVWLPFFIFPFIGNHHPNCLIFFRGVAQPPTSQGLWKFTRGQDASDCSGAFFSKSHPYVAGKSQRMEVSIAGKMIEVGDLPASYVLHVMFDYRRGCILMYFALSCNISLC